MKLAGGKDTEAVAMLGARLSKLRSNAPSVLEARATKKLLLKMQASTPQKRPTA